MNERSKNIAVLLASFAVHLGVFSYFVIENFLGITWLHYLLPDDPVTVAAGVIAAGFFYGLLQRPLRWRVYLGGSALAAIVLCAFAVLLGYAMRNPNGPAEPVGKYLLESFTDLLNLLFIGSLFTVPIVLAAIGVGIGAGTRWVWKRIVSEPLKKREIAAG